VDVSAKAPSTVRRMGNQIEVRREISAPADTVYRFVSDVTRMGEWSPETTGCGWINGADGPAVGARFKGTNKHGSKTWSTVCTVVAADPGRRFAFTVAAGPVKIAEWAYVIEPTATGCVVTETWADCRGGLIGGLIKRLGKPVSGVGDREAHNRAGMETTLERLAAKAESAG